MNQLEQAIFDGFKSAQRDYENITDGWWLWHGPEAFLMCSIARAINKKGGYSVYLDASPKKVQRDYDEPQKGRPRNDQGKRFDLVVWKKSENKLKAIIEIKRSLGVHSLLIDRKKMVAFLRGNNDAIAAYLFVYTEAKGYRREITLNNRLGNWERKLKHSRLVAHRVEPHMRDGRDEWGRAAGLYRIYR